MEEAVHITYNKAVEELRAREYPMLEGWLSLEMSVYVLTGIQARPISTMPEPPYTPSR